MNYLSSLKLFRHPIEYAKWYMEGKTNNPITVKIDLTNKCNHSCEHCIDKDLRGNEEIENALSALSGLHRCGVKGIHFTGGGEPLLHPNAVIIFSHAKELGFETGLITNGSLLKSRYAQYFDWIKVSLDAYDEESYKKMHGKKANWNQTINGIKSVIGKTFVTISSLYFEDVFIKFTKTLKPNAIQISPFVGTNKFPIENNFERLEDYGNSQTSIIINKEKYNILPRDYTVCDGQHFKGTNICADGNVYICCQLAGKEYAKIGNIYENTFGYIWNSDLRQEVIKNLDVTKCPELCVCDSLNRLLQKIKNYEHEGSI